MPNWCANNVKITHKDTSKLSELRDAYKRGELMEHFMPTPKEPDDPTKLLGQGKPIKFDGSEDWHSWRVNNWGTKWDVGGKDAFSDDTPEGLVLSFDTAWSPPIGFYEYMKKQGFGIRASYFGPGMGFCGEWIDGTDNYHEGVWRNYPDHLIEEYNMVEFYEDDEEEVLD